MSFKRRPENIASSVAITPDKKKKYESEDTSYAAVLAPSNLFPKVSFEDVKLHFSVSRDVYLKNPTENILQVELTKLPDETRGYHWSATEFELPKESQALLVITWTPTEYGSWYDTVKIVNKKTKEPLSELKLSSSTVVPPKVLKTQSGRSRSVLAKKQNDASKQGTVRKPSTLQAKSENKENELTSILASINLNKTSAEDSAVKIFNLDEENSVCGNVPPHNLNEREDNLNKFSKYIKINKTYLIRAEDREMRKNVLKAKSKTFNEDEDFSPSGTPNYSAKEKYSCPQGQNEPSSSLTHNIDKQNFEVSNHPKQEPLIWSISPPNSVDKGKDSRKTIACHLPKRNIPVQLTRSNLARRSNGPQLKEDHTITGKVAKNINPPGPSRSSENDGGAKKPSNTGVYSEEVFLVPSTRVKRGSLAKATNSSPPKIRKLSELKIKRLSTPVSRKMSLKCSTEGKQRFKAEVPPSVTRSATVLKKRKSLKVDWVPAVRKLKLSTNSQSEEDISPSPVDLATPDPFLAATTSQWLNPFEQENELIQWADRMLRPPNELELDRDQSERSSLHRLNALRATTFNILTSTEVATVLSKVKIAVDNNIITIRSDRQPHAYLGLQDKIITLLMSYNPLWLRLCLEAVYQCNIQLKCHSDEGGLRDFIRRYVLNDEYLRQTYSHPTISHLMLPEFEDQMKKFTVYKFLVLVYLLDLVKRKKVILHDPCLFKKGSKLKSSKEILVDFNKDFVAAAGDITRILRLRGYEVLHQQTYIDEFDFSLTSTNELRDGVRLTRLAENLVGDNSLCSKLRVPAVSNLQKKFNAEVAFTALKKAGYDLPPDVNPKDISDGHHEKTLLFLWHLRGIIQKRAALVIITKWNETKQLREDRRNFLKIKTSVIKIQKWYRKIKKAGTPSNEEIKKGFEARQKLSKLKTAMAIMQRTAGQMVNRIFRPNKLAKSHRESFLSIESATTTIQKKASKQERQDFLKKNAAAIIIQKWFRAYKLAKSQRENFLNLKHATVVIQRKFRNWVTVKHQRQEFLILKTAIITVQRVFRAQKLMKKHRENFLRLRTAVVCIQRIFRKNKTTRAILEESSVHKKEKAATLIQSVWRGYLVRRAMTVPQPRKIKPSTDNHQPISARGQCYFQVLSKHRKCSVAELQNTLSSIDVITGLSADQCGYFVRNGSVKILFDILDHQANRSIGTHKCVECVLSILLNFYRAPVTAETVWKETIDVNGIFIVFNLMMLFKSDKTSTVFCKACTVIWLFAQDRVKAETIMKMPKIQQLYNYILKSLKKPGQPCSSGLKRSTESRQSTKKPASATRKKIPAIRFNFGRYFNDTRAFDDKNFALDCVIDKLSEFVEV